MEDSSAQPAHGARRVAVPMLMTAMLGLVLAFATLLVVAGRSNAATAAYTGPLTIRWYSFDSDTCTQRTDPVTVIFTGYADKDRTNNHLDHDTSWDHTILDGSPQYFEVDGRCVEMDDSLATETAAETRYLIRTRSTFNEHQDYGMV